MSKQNDSPAASEMRTFGDLAVWKKKIRGSRGALSPRQFGSNPLASEELVFVAVRRKDGVVALDRKTGKSRWRRSFGSLSFGELRQANGLLYAQASRMLYALEPVSGRLVWKTPLGDHIGVSDSAIVVDEDNLFLGYRAGLFWCIDALSGEPRWSQLAPYRAERTPVNGVPLIHQGLAIVPTLTSYVVAYEVVSGQEVWRQVVNGRCADEVVLYQGSATIPTEAGVQLLDPSNGRVLGKLAWEGRGVRSVSAAGELLVVLTHDQSARSLGEECRVLGLRGDEVVYDVPCAGPWPQLTWHEGSDLLLETSWNGLGVLDPGRGDRLLKIHTRGGLRASWCCPPTFGTVMHIF